MCGQEWVATSQPLCLTKASVSGRNLCSVCRTVIDEHYSYHQVDLWYSERFIIKRLLAKRCESNLNYFMFNFV